MGKVFSSTPPPHKQELEKPWRKMTWDTNNEIQRELEDLLPNIEVLRILLIGPTGAGKSSFINSVQRVLLGRNFNSALENSAFTGTSFTLSKKTYQLKKHGRGHYPFEFIDVMGLQPQNQGIHPKDVTSILKGYILDGYTFNPVKPISADDKKYNKSPSLCHKVHCVVSILPADSVSRMEDGNYEKFRVIRAKASELGIPQVIVLTKVDRVCELVSQDLTKIYHSTKIQEKVNHCSNKVGISTNNIYPVENYHTEILQDDKVNLLILMALRDIVNFANDYVETLKSTDDKSQ